MLLKLILGDRATGVEHRVVIGYLLYATCVEARMRDDDMLELGMEAARLAVRGEEYELFLADGLLRILKADGGVGITTWHLPVDHVEPGALTGITVVGSGMPVLAPDAIESAMAVASRHPSFRLPDLFRPHAERLSDHVEIARFWDTDVWLAMHGHGDGSDRYPAAAELGRHGDIVVFAAVHRSRRDFDADDMQLLDALTTSPLVPALAFRHAWDRASRMMKASADSGRTERITRREAEVHAMVAQGLTNQHIGHLLGISERTVRRHLENINDKLGTVNRASAVNRWRRRCEPDLPNLGSQVEPADRAGIPAASTRSRDCNAL